MDAVPFETQVNSPLTIDNLTQPMLKSLLIILLLAATATLYAQLPKVLSFSPDSASGNSYVYIKGRNFVNVIKVTFGGIPAYYFSVTTDSTITAITGAGNTGYVAVKTSHGVDSLAGFTFMHGPVFTSFTPVAASYGDTVTIRGKYFISMQGIYFGDSAALSFTVIGDTIIKAVVANGTSGEVYGYGDYGYYYLDGFDFLGPSIRSFSPTSGSAGTLVTIKGRHFTGTTGVFFGGIAAASFSIVTDSVISAVVGNGGPGDIKVQTPKGTATAPHFILPFINNFPPAYATRFDTVRITGFNFTGATTVYFGDSSAVSFTVVSDSLITAVVGNGSSGYIKVGKGSLMDSSSYPFTYYPYQPKILSFTPATGTDQTVVTITGKQLIGTTAVSFGNRPADSFTVVSNTRIIATVGLGNSGFVSVINNNIKDSLAGFTYFVSPPVVTGFTPASGPVGTQVTINGSGFNPVPGNNIVYFGGVKAVITAATRTALTVAVPPGAGYSPISVTFNTYTGYSRKNFLVTFPGGASGFSASGYEPQFKITTVGSNPAKMAAGDFDGDGKIDIAIVYGYFGTNNTTMSVYRNTGSNGNIVFAAPVEYTAGTQGYSGFDVAATDVDGDGKPDLIALSTGESRFGIFKNTSTPGNLSFAARKDYSTGSISGPEGTNPRNITVADFDADGRPDVAFAGFGLDNWCKVTYIRNTTENGIISFGQKSDYPIVDAYLVTAGNLDNDNKPDIGVGIYVNGSFMQEINLLANTSTSGILSFQQNQPVGPSNSLRPSKIVFGDLDNDGRVDMVVGNGNGFSVSVYKNLTTSNGNILFDIPLEYVAGANNNTVQGVAISDADGDGKPDILVTLGYDRKVLIFKNTTVNNNILFAAPKIFTTGFNPADVICEDLNGDGRPDIVTANSGDSTISILRNNVGGPLKLCPPVASFSISADISGSSYQWQVDTGNNIFSNIPNNSFYSGTTAATLQLTAIPSSFTGYQYRCAVNANYSYPVKLQFENRWIGDANSLWKTAGNWSCGVIPDANTDVVIRSGYVILNSNGICRTLTVMPGATFTVYPGFTLTITH